MTVLAALFSALPLQAESGVYLEGQFILKDGRYYGQPGQAINGLVRVYRAEDGGLFITESEVRDGLKNGLESVYVNGYLQKETEYAQGKKNGRAVLYSEAGGLPVIEQLYQDDLALEQQHYRGGKLVSDFTYEYHSNGGMKLKSPKTVCAEDCFTYRFDENGAVTEKKAWPEQ